MGKAKTRILSTGVISNGKIISRSDADPGCSGFTLVELMVVMVLIGLISALVAPRLAGSVPKLQLQAVAGKISAALRYARSQAVTENRTYTAVFDFGHNRLYVVDRPMVSDLDFEDLQKTARESGLRQKIYDLPRGVALKTSSSGQNEIVTDIFALFFYATGGSSGGTVTLASDRDRRCRINIDPIIGTVAPAAL